MVTSILHDLVFSERKYLWKVTKCRLVMILVLLLQVFLHPLHNCFMKISLYGLKRYFVFNELFVFNMLED